MLGKIQLENFEGLTSMPQGYASAWTSVEGLVDVSYKPLLCAAKQLVHGTNYFFIAEETFVSNPSTRKLVKLVINELGGEYTFVGTSDIL